MISQVSFYLVLYIQNSSDKIWHQIHHFRIAEITQPEDKSIFELPFHRTVFHRNGGPSGYLIMVSLLAPGVFEWNLKYFWKLNLSLGGWVDYVNLPSVISTELNWWWVNNICSLDCMVTSATNPLHEPMLTQTFIIIWRRPATTN